MSLQLAMNSASNPINEATLKFQSGLARVTYKLIAKHSKDFENNPLDEKIFFLLTTLQEMIKDGQEILDHLRRKTKKAEGSCWLSKRTSKFLLVGGVCALAATISTLVVSIFQCEAAQSSTAGLVTGSAAAIFMGIKEYAKDRKDDADDAAKKARELEREQEIKQAKLLCSFLTQCYDFKKLSKKKDNPDKFTGLFKTCVHNLNQLPDVYRRQMPHADVWTSNFIKCLPKSHPIKSAVLKLVEIARRQEEPGHLQKLSSSPSEQDEKASVAQSKVLEKPRKDNKENESLEKEYQHSWNELEKMLPTEVGELVLDGYRLTKKGALPSPKARVLVSVPGPGIHIHTASAAPPPIGTSLNTDKRPPSLASPQPLAKAIKNAKK